MEAKLSIDGQAAVLNALRGVIKNQQVLADAMGVELPISTNELSSLINNVRGMASSAIQLPPVLNRTMRNRDAFSKAVEKGYIRTSSVDGLLEWTLGNNTLLAYFCGRLWCGDSSTVVKRMNKAFWHQGDTTFPSAALTRLFGVLNLKKLRQNREERVLPVNYEQIDALF